MFLSGEGWVLSTHFPTKTVIGPNRPVLGTVFCATSFQVFEMPRVRMACCCIFKAKESVSNAYMNAKSELTFFLFFRYAHAHTKLDRVEKEKAELEAKVGIMERKLMVWPKKISLKCRLFYLDSFSGVRRKGERRGGRQELDVRRIRGAAEEL